MTPFWARTVLVRRLDSFAQAACLSCHPFTNLLSKIDKKWKVAHFSEYLGMSLLIWDTSLKYVLFTLFDKLAEVTKLQKILVRNVKIQNPKTNFLIQNAYLEYPCLESTESSMASTEYVSSPRGTLHCLQIGLILKSFIKISISLFTDKFHFQFPNLSVT